LFCSAIGLCIAKGREIHVRPLCVGTVLRSLKERRTPERSRRIVSLRRRWNSYPLPIIYVCAGRERVFGYARSRLKQLGESAGRRNTTRRRLRIIRGGGERIVTGLARRYSVLYVEWI
jgi:hypothetical protein